jgi:altronate hydrolase
VAEAREALDREPLVPMGVDELVVGRSAAAPTAPAASPATPPRRAFDALIEAGAACIFEETGELIGCEHIMAARARTAELGAELRASVSKAARYYATLGYGSFAAGNADGGLSTIEEKSLGAYAKSGASPITGLLKPGDIPPKGGSLLLDVVPDGEVRFGFPNINDNAEIAELIACGAHAISSSPAGARSWLGHLARSEDLRQPRDLPAASRTTWTSTPAASSRAPPRSTRWEARSGPRAVLGLGHRTRSEALGHQEFILTYKSFEPIGLACLPA